MGGNSISTHPVILLGRSQATGDATTCFKLNTVQLNTPLERVQALLLLSLTKVKMPI